MQKQKKKKKETKNKREKELKATVQDILFPGTGTKLLESRFCLLSFLNKRTKGGSNTNKSRGKEEKPQGDLEEGMLENTQLGQVRPETSKHTETMPLRRGDETATPEHPSPQGWLPQPPALGASLTEADL